MSKRKPKAYPAGEVHAALSAAQSALQTSLRKIVMREIVAERMKNNLGARLNRDLAKRYERHLEILSALAAEAWDQAGRRS